MRQKLIKVRETAFKLGEEAELDRIETTKVALVRYGEIENQVSKARQDETTALSLFVECIKPEIDLVTYASEFNNVWASPTYTHYESYRARKIIPSRLILSLNI